LATPRSSPGLMVIIPVFLLRARRRAVETVSFEKVGSQQADANRRAWGTELQKAGITS
jgi:hypothetical protein